MDPNLSVIIPTYNRRDSLLGTLNSLAIQTLPLNAFEVIVVSDGSPDDSESAVAARKWPYALRLLTQKNSGPSVARNYGAKEAITPLLVFLDDDIEPTPIFLESHILAHRDDADLVVIGPQSMPQNEWFPVWIAWEHLMLERQYSRFRSGEWEVGPNNLYSGNFSVGREHLLTAGGFDENFKRQEDVELGFRLASLGMHFQFVPEADGIHRPTRSYDSWLSSPYLYGIRDVQMARDKGEMRSMELARKHYRLRNMVTRILARTCIGRPMLEPALFASLTPLPLALDRIGQRRSALTACSLLFNLLYLRGMAGEFGGAAAMWRELGMGDR